jgi:prolyl-tRNA synthetase
LIGALIMMHADDDGMILPPRIAPAHVVILPITPKEETKLAVLEAAATLRDKIAARRYADESIRVEIDQRDIAGGAKSWEWIKRGVPVRIEIGPRDLSAGTVALFRRDHPVKEKMFQPSTEIVDQLPVILGEIQRNLYDRAKVLRDSNTVRIDSKKDFYDFFTPKNYEKPEIHGGFALAHWSGNPDVEAQIKEELKVTIRCIPFDQEIRDDRSGQCVISGEPSPRRVLFAKSY